MPVVRVVAAVVVVRALVVAVEAQYEDEKTKREAAMSQLEEEHEHIELGLLWLLPVIGLDVAKGALFPSREIPTQHHQRMLIDMVSVRFY